MFYSAVILLISTLFLPATLLAAEISNLRTNFASSRLTIEYDLATQHPGKESAIEVLLDINGKTYTSNMLSMSGDFGGTVVAGANRRIVWHHLRDFPEGLESDFKCRVNALPKNAVIDEWLTPAEGFKNYWFAVNKQTVVETRSRLMWARNADMLVKPMRYADALKLVENLNQERFAGYNDWRIPTRVDFTKLVLFGKTAGWGAALGHFIADYLTGCGFTNVQAGNYWTSTPAETASKDFLVVNTWNGGIKPLDASNYYYVWPVRSLQ
jgi:hypothetical protein